ncbi:hypothetical protein IFM89_027812, partial [Coptis chinensis]
MPALLQYSMRASTPSILTQDASIHGGGTAIYQRIQNGFRKSYVMFTVMIWISINDARNGFRSMMFTVMIWIPRSKQCSSSLKKMQILFARRGQRCTTRNARELMKPVEEFYRAYRAFSERSRSRHRALRRAHRP